MKIQQFLEHHGIARNPFADEDAQTDPVFKEFCIASTYHPAWDKVYGDPSEPATAIVFGEKGAGKTALRLQIIQQLQKYNADHPRERTYVIEYDDFNIFLDRFRDRLTTRLPDRVLAEWQLWDHMDAILTLGVTDLIDRILDDKRTSDQPFNPIDQADLAKLDRFQARDLLVLCACYDHSTHEPFIDRWRRLAAKLGYGTWSSWMEMAIGIASTIGVVTLAVLLMVYGWWAWDVPFGLCLVLLAAGWYPWLARSFSSLIVAYGIVNNVRVGNREIAPLRQALMHFTAPELSGQPLPTRERTDDRYELLDKFRGVLETLGYRGVIVLVDRVDEPHLINGSSELMKALVWPLLDNKFLKNQGVGLKLLLPIEMSFFLDRETREFYQRSRLDKQNMVPSLAWTGEALFDVANSRLRGCALNGKPLSLRDLFDASVGDRRLLDAFQDLRVPRHLFKFLYRLLVAHCNAHMDNEPAWKISSPLFESTLALYRRDQEAFDRGLGAG